MNKIKKFAFSAIVSLAMAFTFSSCSKEEAAELICLNQGFTYDSGTGKCIGEVGTNGQCPDGSSLSGDGKFCMADAVEEGSAPANTNNNGNNNGNGTTTGNDNTDVNGNIVVGNVSEWNFYLSEERNVEMEFTEEDGIVSVSGSLSFTVDDWAYGSLFAMPKNNTELEKFRTANYISFKTKGDGGKYDVKLIVLDQATQYRAFFTTSSAEKTVKVCYSDLALAYWEGEEDKEPKPFDKSKIAAVHWGAHSPEDFDERFEGRVTANFNFTIRDVAVGNDPSCN